MISKYLKTKNIIDQINPTVNIEELSKDISSDGYYYLKLSDQSSSYYYYRGLFNDYEIQKILSICNKLPDQDGSLGGNNINKTIRESNISWVPVNNETLWMYQKFTNCIHECNESFFEYDLTKIEKLQFTRYFGNQKGFYSPHVDCNYGYLNENRKLTFVMQLSDPEDYEGGELRLYMSKHYDSIPKEKGLITFFPSHTLHECSPVTFGTRYTLVGWVYGPKLK